MLMNVSLRFTLLNFRLHNIIFDNDYAKRTLRFKYRPILNDGSTASLKLMNDHVILKVTVSKNVLYGFNTKVITLLKEAWVSCIDGLTAEDILVKTSDTAFTYYL